MAANTRSHTHTHTAVHVTFMQRLKQGGGEQNRNPPPTMYDPFVFCDRRGTEREFFFFTWGVSVLMLQISKLHTHNQRCD